MIGRLSPSLESHWLKTTDCSFLVEFSFNSSTLNIDSLECHLELSVLQTNSGFYGKLNLVTSLGTHNFRILCLLQPSEVALELHRRVHHWLCPVWEGHHVYYIIQKWQILWSLPAGYYQELAVTFNICSLNLKYIPPPHCHYKRIKVFFSKENMNSFNCYHWIQQIKIHCENVSFSVILSNESLLLFVHMNIRRWILLFSVTIFQ